MELPKTYNPKPVEDKWYKHWVENGYFRSVPDERESYTIVIPPPNVTGVLHMGHMLNNTIQDVLIRRARMLGKNACWVPGTDHASIATEAKVVGMLREKGIKKSDLSREDFNKYAWEWKEKYGGIILKQLEKLGCSCDWDRTKFTADPDLSEAVIDTFIDLYKKGFIYRGLRMVNWDPVGLTAVSDEEVIYKEVNSKLYYVKYKIDGANDEWITVATTRPETILGDTAVCVHPDDERYGHLKGKFAIIPIVNRKVPVIFDDYIDREFGTGALKVTPAHDVNDYNIGLKHKLEVIDTIAPNGTMSKEAQFFIGEDRFVVRKKIAKQLEEMGQVVKVDDIRNNVGFSERTDAVIEPKLSLQWYVKMSEISKPAYEAVVNGGVSLIPPKFINTYKHWMENVRDWCISRQLWWGQRIPAWYDDHGNYVVAKTKEEAIKQFEEKGLKFEGLRQDEDVVDTWFSSWLWPITVFDPKAIAGGKDYKGNMDLQYYYPTNDLVTAPDILFFWVARMIISGYEYRGKKPFTNVYLTGIVRDKQGRKMSKQLGNSPDPLELIEKHGADAMRVGMLLCAPAGNDLLFDVSYIEQGSSFANKIWNAFRLVNGLAEKDEVQGDRNRLAVKWFEARFNQELNKINQLFSDYKISEALMAIYKLLWDDYCSWYLEMIKPEFIDGNPTPLDRNTYQETINFFQKLLKIIHPFMPFITEELWQLTGKNEKRDLVMVSVWPKVEVNHDDKEILDYFNVILPFIKEVRALYQKFSLNVQKDVLEVHIKTSLLFIFEDSAANRSNSYFSLIRKFLPKLTVLWDSRTLGAQSHVIMIESVVNPSIDIKAERERISKELDYFRGFISSVSNKLSNERFVQSAKPELIALERKKRADAEAKIKALEEQLRSL